jgi:hypothetical protein
VYIFSELHSSIDLRNTEDECTLSVLYIHNSNCVVTSWNSTTAPYLVYVRFEVFTAVTLMNVIFLDVTPCGSCKNPDDGGAKFLRIIGSYKSHAA